jgi:hypothetical protein
MKSMYSERLHLAQSGHREEFFWTACNDRFRLQAAIGLSLLEI